MGRRRELNVVQREAIRSVADGKPVIEIDAVDLERKGLINIRRGPLGTTEAQTLTPRGREVHRQIMASGDGPEALKEMLRFDGGGR